MKKFKFQSGFTLIEMIVVVGVVAILVSMVMTVATRVQNKAKEQLTKSTLDILNGALSEFADFGYRYKGKDAFVGSDQGDFYAGLKFPLDCNGLIETDVETELEDALWLDSGDVVINSPDPQLEDSGIATAYFLLSRVPGCREILAGIDGSLVKSNGAIAVGGIEYPWVRVVDAWGEPLRYDLYYEAGNFQDWIDTRRSFPLIISSGLDKEFGTDDDISNE